ncbi:NUDIX hydrolase [Microvirga brassicacearum]|nr:hypothetical protein [Microvirga brassicacearum]
MSATPDQPRVLIVPAKQNLQDGLPSGPLLSEHRTLETALRSWVEQQTALKLGYVEQLYTFGDRDRTKGRARVKGHALSIAYLALVRDASPSRMDRAHWRDWYAYLPWEDWREGTPKALKIIEPTLKAWVRAGGPPLKQFRAERVEMTFGLASGAWSDERVLERYELLFEASLVPEAWRERSDEKAPARLAPGLPMVLDHRRMLATAIGRLRAKIKYRPVIFELMPASFTLLDLQKTVEALSGIRLHKQNFRRLVESEGLVEETGEVTTATGGRPARLVRFRQKVLVERPAPGVRLPGSKRVSP